MKKRMKLSLALGIFLSVCASAENWVKRTDFEVDPAWSPNRSENIPWRMMFDFFSASPWADDQGGAWHCVLTGAMETDKSKIVPGTEKLVELPLFKESWLCLRTWPPVDFRKIGSGEEPLALRHFLTPELWRVADLLEANDRYYTVISRMREGQYIFDTNYRWEMEEFQNWKKSHPHFLAFNVDEWCNDYLSAIASRFAAELKKGNITQEEYDKGLKKYQYERTAVDITRYFHDIFDTFASFLYNDPQNMIIMHAYWNMAHIAANKGAGHLFLETTNSTGPDYETYRWQPSMFYTRGAARQFQTRWSWYIASFYNGFDTKGEFAETHYSYDEGRFTPYSGMSQSLVRRAHYLSWLSGAFMAHRESAYGTLFRLDEADGEYRLTPYGEDTVEFYDVVRRNPDRGVPYTPVALLTPYVQVQTAAGGPAWARTDDYPPGLAMIDAFMSTIIPVSDRKSAIRQGVEGCLYNSPYGDIFDVFNPDAPSPDKVLRNLAAYKVAILLGDYEPDPRMAEELVDYVRGGGTLVVNAVHLKTFDFPEGFTGEGQSATVIKADENGSALFTLHEYGAGHVILTTPEYMLSRPLIDELLARIVSEVLPLRVTGDIQYGINKTQDGYLLYLFNNKGVTKYTDTREQFDPTAVSKVTVELKEGRADTVAELLSEQEIATATNSFHIEVDPGQLAVLRIKIE